MHQSTENSQYRFDTVKKINIFIYKCIHYKYIMVTNITKNTFKVLDILQNSLIYSMEQNKLIPDIEGFLTRKNILNKAKISKQTLSNILKRDKEFFLGTTNKEFEIIYGLSEKGYQNWNEYYSTYILPTKQELLIKDTKKIIDKYLTKKFKILEDKDLNEFHRIFMPSFIGMREPPFEIKIKRKDKFKNGGYELYKLVMDDDLAKK